MTSAADLVKEIRASAERLVEASSTLIVVHSFAASAELVCRGIEQAAGYFTGAQARRVSRASFLRFAEHYLPELGRTRVCAASGNAAILAAGAAASCRRSGGLFTIVPATTASEDAGVTCAEAVYAAWQGGLFHDGERATGVRVVDDKGRWMLSFLADGSARLNAIPFQSQFERGLKHYLADLARDAELGARAERRSAFLSKPAFAQRSG